MHPPSFNGALARDFLDKAVRPPTAEEKEEAKQWVEDHSCYAWRNGWLFVDGTPLLPTLLVRRSIFR